MFNREMPKLHRSDLSETPLAANENIPMLEGDVEFQNAVRNELDQINLTLEGEELRTAFTFRMEKLNDGSKKNYHIIEELARIHQIMEAEALIKKRREEMRAPAVSGNVS